MHIFIGALAHTLNSTTIQYSPKSIVGVSKQGTIDFIVHLHHDYNGKSVPETIDAKKPKEVDVVLEEIFSNEEYQKKGWTRNAKRTVLNHGEFLCPGFVDTHTHGQWFTFFLSSI